MGLGGLVRLAGRAAAERGGLLDSMAARRRVNYSPDIGGWTDPTKPQVEMLIPNGADQVFFTDYLDADGQILATSEQVFNVAGDC